MGVKRKVSQEGQQIARWQAQARPHPMSDQELAFRLGVRESTLWRWKRGLSRVRPMYLREIQRLCSGGKPLG